MVSNAEGVVSAGYIIAAPTADAGQPLSDISVMEFFTSSIARYELMRSLAVFKLKGCRRANRGTPKITSLSKESPSQEMYECDTVVVHSFHRIARCCVSIGIGGMVSPIRNRRQDNMIRTALGYHFTRTSPSSSHIPSKHVVKTHGKSEI